MGARTISKAELAARIKARRIARGWSQAELARRVGYRPPSICLVENASRGVPDDRLPDFARAFETTVEALISVDSAPEIAPDGPLPELDTLLNTTRDAAARYVARRTEERATLRNLLVEDRRTKARAWLSEDDFWRLKESGANVVIRCFRDEWERRRKSIEKGAA